MEKIVIKDELAWKLYLEKIVEPEENSIHEGEPTSFPCYVQTEVCDGFFARETKYKHTFITFDEIKKMYKELRDLRPVGPVATRDLAKYMCVGDVAYCKADGEEIVCTEDGLTHNGFLGYPTTFFANLWFINYAE